MSVKSTTPAIREPRPPTSIVSTVVPWVVAGAPGGIGNAGDFECTLAVVAGPLASVATSIDHELKLPLLLVASSVIDRVQVPFGFSPRNAARRPSGESGVAVTWLA